MLDNVARKRVFNPFTILNNFLITFVPKRWQHTANYPSQKFSLATSFTSKDTCILGFKCICHLCSKFQRQLTSLSVVCIEIHLCKLLSSKLIPHAFVHLKHCKYAISMSSPSLEIQHLRSFLHRFTAPWCEFVLGRDYIEMFFELIYYWELNFQTLWVNICQNRTNGIEQNWKAWRVLK